MIRMHSKELFAVNRRFDLIYKILCMENQGVSTITKEYYEKLYLESIRFFNDFYENYPLKTTKEDFLNSFKETYENILKDGFSDEYPIPVNHKCQLYDGAHRLSIAYVLDKEVCIEYKEHNDIFDYKFFKDRHMSLKIADIGALEYVLHNKNAHIVQVFPNVSKKYDAYIEKVLNEYGFIYYKKEFLANYNAIVNIKKINYGEELWAGNEQNRYIGLQLHARECIGYNKMRVYVFCCKNLDDAVSAKEKIRDKLSRGNFPIHINDKHEEAVKLANIYFSSTGIDWLGSKSFGTDKYLDEICNEFKGYCEKHKKNSDNICVAGSSVMALYGLRKSNDIDCIFTGGDVVEDDGNVSSHESEKKYYPSSFEELIQEHNNYLLINGVKFLTLNNLIKFKIKRREWYKDYIDLCSMLFLKKLNKVKNNVITYLYLVPRRNFAKMLSR